MNLDDSQLKEYSYLNKEVLRFYLNKEYSDFFEMMKHFVLKCKMFYTFFCFVEFISGFNKTSVSIHTGGTKYQEPIPNEFRFSSPKEKGKSAKRTKMST